MTSASAGLSGRGVRSVGWACGGCHSLSVFFAWSSCGHALIKYYTNTSTTTNKVVVVNPYKCEHPTYLPAELRHRPATREANPSPRQASHTTRPPCLAPIMSPSRAITESLSSCYISVRGRVFVQPLYSSHDMAARSPGAPQSSSTLAPSGEPVWWPLPLGMDGNDCGAGCCCAEPS